LAIAKTLLRLDRPVGDEALAFGFAVGRAIFAPLKAPVSQPCCRRIEAMVGVPGASGVE
jgi:hypothetical protein